MVSDCAHALGDIIEYFFWLIVGDLPDQGDVLRIQEGDPIGLSQNPQTDSNVEGNIIYTPRSRQGCT